MVDYLYVTRVNIKLDVPEDFDFKDTGEVNFDPSTTKHYAISHPNLVIQDTTGAQHTLKIPLTVQQDATSASSGEGKFSIFFSLNGIAINPMQVNASHTAPFVRSSSQAKSSQFVLGENFLTTSDVFQVKPQDWDAASLTITQPNTSANILGDIKMEPAAPKNPKYTNIGVPPFRTDEPILLQPLGPLNMIEIDWNQEDLTQGDSVFTSSDVNAQQLAQIEANKLMGEAVKENANQSPPTKPDVGWLGLSEADRSKTGFNRFHIIKVFFHPKKAPLNLRNNEIAISARGIKIYRGTKEQEGNNTYAPGGNGLKQNGDAFKERTVISAQYDL